MIGKFLNKDSMWLGIILGVLVPIISVGFFIFIDRFVATYFFNLPSLFSMPTIQVIAIFINVLVFRYYMLKKYYDYTGRGILLATFIYAFVYFYLYMDKMI
ncbi:MAG TPA: hypothetical protein PKH65_05580 [Bacteroidia bacterium]|nr:hypothetical protein [Bacteroidia bacterium]HNT80133.1 hypothetical protein [Bacteroidia bacterium]